MASVDAERRLIGDNAGRVSIVQSDITARRKLSEGPALGGSQSISNRSGDNRKFRNSAMLYATRCRRAARWRAIH
jgi:hypothetical protein